jgi:beta-galactosidase
MWRVRFEPGVLKLVSRKNGKEILKKEMHTAGEPASIHLRADRKIINANGKDISFITISIVDQKGYPVPEANNNINCIVTGRGLLVALDNGYQADTSSFKNSSKKCWMGKLSAIVQSDGKQGNITVRVSSPGLAPASLTLKARH